MAFSLRQRHFLNVFLWNLRNYTYVCRFQNAVLRCLTPRLHCFLSSHWPSFRFLSFMAFLIPSIQFFFSLPCVLFCFGIHFNAVLGNLPSAILWTWPYHVSCFCSISFTIGSSNPICCLIVTFPILSFLDILEGLLRASISVASTRLLFYFVLLRNCIQTFIRDLYSFCIYLGPASSQMKCSLY